MENDYKQLLEYLRSIGLEGISKTEKKSLYQRLQKNGLESVKKELEVLYALNRVLIDSYQEVSIANMNRINNEIDSNLLFKLFFVYDNIKEKGLTNLNTLSAFKKESLKILQENRNVNLELEKIVRVASTHLQLQQEALYFTMLSKEKADVLLANCYKRAKLSLQKCQVSNLDSVVTCLKRNFHFSDDDLVKVSSQCATLFALSNSEKLINLDNTLKEFKNYISEQMAVTNKNIDASKFLNRNFKDILTSSASIAITDSSTLETTIRFLKGEELGKLSTSAEGDFAKIKAKFTPAQLAKLYSKSLTCLSTSMNKIADSCENIAIAYERYFNEKLKLDNIVNGRNFASLTTLRKEDYLEDGKIGVIFNLLSSFVTKDDMQNLLENNFGFLKANVEDVVLGIEEAILESKNNDELQKQILRRIRGQFARNNGKFDFSKMENTVSVDKKKDVKIKNMEEEEILDLLTKLRTSQSKIDEWKKSWNKEEREYRELELQIDLESLIDETNTLKEMLDFDLFNVNEFSSEIEIVQDLFEDILAERQIVLADKKLNKNTTKLVKTIDENIYFIKDSINKKIDKLNKTYSSMIDSLCYDLDKVISNKAKYIEFKNRLEEKELEIIEKKIDQEDIVAMQKEIDSISEMVDFATKAIKRSDAIEAACNKKVEEFGDLLFEREKENIKKDLLKVIDDHHVGAKYMFNIFLYILWKDDLIYPPEDAHLLDLDDEDAKLTLDEYVKLLNLKEAKLAKEIYKGFESTIVESHELFDRMCVKLESFDAYGEDITTIRIAIKALQQVHDRLNKENNDKRTLLRSKAYLENEVKKFNEEELSNEFDRLSDAISEYQSIIDMWNNRKM